jgi:hypothetical protein
MANTAMNPQGGLYPMGMIDKTQYATPIQRPVSSEMVMDAPAYERSNPMLMAGGGEVKGYAVGGFVNPRGTMSPEMQAYYAQDFANQRERAERNEGLFGAQPLLPERPTPQVAATPIAQPTGQSTFPGASSMQGGFGQGAQGYPSFAMGSGGFGGGGSGAFPLEGRYGIVKMASGGDVNLDEERQKLIMKNIKGASTKELEKILGTLNEQDFLRRNMPGYAESMRPSISSMVEGAQYGDRMSKSFIDMARENALKSGNDFQEPSQNYARITPTNVDPQSGMYSGIASIGQNIDPQTRVNAMANIQRTPFDRNVMDAVRRVGVGVDRQIGKDANLSAFYEQDPMGRSKMGGARFTQRFVQGGMSNLGGYSDGGRMLKGPGDGMSDDIPGVIGGKQPARLADGEFVVPADVVSHLGNGSTDAGAKRLYAMMDKVRKARTGNKKQGKQIKAEKYLPA